MVGTLNLKAVVAGALQAATLPPSTRTLSLVCFYPPSYLNAQLDVLLVGTLSPEAVVARALQAAIEEHVAVVGVHFVQYD